MCGHLGYTCCWEICIFRKVFIETFTGLTCLIENFLAILLCSSFTWRFPKISIFRCFRMFLLLATNKNALFWKRHRSLFGARTLSVSLIPAQKYWRRSRVFQAELFGLAIIIFGHSERIEVVGIVGCPLSHGQRSSEERRPRKWYNNIRGGICCYTHPCEKPTKLVFLLSYFIFPAVKAFLTEAKEEFNAKWERPSQVRLSRYEL